MPVFMPIVLDTNILLDIFVFNDASTVDLKVAVLNQAIRAIASPKTLDEFTEVIARPLFQLNGESQAAILAQWRSMAELYNDAQLDMAPWICEDADDQIFLDIAFQLRPSILISKDKAILKLASIAAKNEVVITSRYEAFKR
ncbi:putative toxin-antitoxin system toxin component, PIN family [Polynucleobacter antarcticus]